MSKGTLLSLIVIGLIIGFTAFIINKEIKERPAREREYLNELQQQTDNNFKTPDVVATNTPRGTLYHVYVATRGHHVYWFGNSSNTVTINYHSGKANHVNVVDGN